MVEQFFEQFRPFGIVEAWLHPAWELALNPGLREQVTKPQKEQSTGWKQILRVFREQYDDSLRSPAKCAYSRRQKRHMNLSPELALLRQAVRDEVITQPLTKEHEEQIRQYLSRPVHSLVDDWVESTRRVFVVNLTGRQRREVEDSATRYVVAARSALDAKVVNAKAAPSDRVVREAEVLRETLQSLRNDALSGGAGTPWEPLFCQILEQVYS